MRISEFRSRSSSSEQELSGSWSTVTTHDKEKPLLKACGLGRRKPGSEDWLLRGVCIAIRAGDRIALIGPSGSGKTVLLRALALLDPHDEGSIEWEARSLSGEAIPAYRTQVVYLHQRPALFEGTVEDNLKYPFTLKSHRGKGIDRERVVCLLETLKRDETFLEKSSRDLSGGEAQIAALIRCLQLDPAMLLLDEPTASLDRATAEAAEELLDRWQLEAPHERNFIWVSHDLEQAKRMSGRRLQMRLGGIQTEE
jgi:putative ABC transport system ATP-binding protein